MEYKRLSVVLFLFVSTYCVAQQPTIRGQLQSEKTAVSSQSITFHRVADTAMIGFVLSDAQGKFQKTLSIDSVLVRVSGLGIQTLDTVVALDRPEVDVVLFVVPSSFELREVVLKNEPIRESITLDTTTYEVAAFANFADGSIEDVLAKMPQFNVDKSSGKIKFKGQEIHTMMVEGQDIFDDDYTVGTQHITPDMVRKIEAIENFSDNTIRGKLQSERKTILNLKLTENAKGQIKAELFARYGIRDWLDSEALLINVGKLASFFSFYQFNNIGIQNSIDLPTMATVAHISSRGLLSMGSFSPNIDVEQYNFNKEHYGTLNVSAKPSAELALYNRTQVYSDRRDLSTLSETNYIRLQNGVAQLNEYRTSHRDIHKIKNTLEGSWVHGEQIQLDLKSTLAYQQNDARRLQTISANNSFDVRDTLNQAGLVWQNMLDFSHKVTDSAVLSSKLTYDRYQQNQHQWVLDREDLRTQDIRVEAQRWQHEVQWLHHAQYHVMNAGLETSYGTTQLATEDTLTFAQLKARLYFNDEWDFNLMRLNYGLAAVYHQFETEQMANQNYLWIQPRVETLWLLGQYQLVLVYQFDVSPPKVDYLVQKPYYTHYRTLRRGTSEVQWEKKQRLALTFLDFDLLSAQSQVLSYIAEYTHDAYSVEVSFDGIIQTETALAIDNAWLQALQYEWTGFVEAIDAKLNSNLSLNHRHTTDGIDGATRREVDVLAYSVGVGYTSLWSEYWQISIDWQYQDTRNYIDGEQLGQYDMLISQLNVSVQAMSNLILTGNLEYRRIHPMDNFFSDILSSKVNLTYELNDYSLAVSLDVRNIADQRHFKEYSLQTISQQTIDYTLLPRQIMGGVALSF